MNTTPALAIAAAYVGTIAAANAAITHIGVAPVGFGLAAPAGVYFAGLAFTLRDLLQDTGGKRAVIAAILTGAVVSLAFGDGRIAAASAAAFLLSELADFAVYTPLRRRGLLKAVAASNAVGLVVDSIVFLTLAFGSLAFLPGQVIGKTWVTLAALPLLAALRARRAVPA